METHVNKTRRKKYRCCVTGLPIHEERARYLLEAGIEEREMTSLEGAELTHRPKMMVYTDDCSGFIICDSIDDSRIYKERFDTEGEKEETLTLEIADARRLKQQLSSSGRKAIDQEQQEEEY